MKIKDPSEAQKNSVIRIEVPALPGRELSPNARVHWRVRNKAKVAYQFEIAAVLSECKDLPAGLTKVWINLTFIFPTKRMRDADNLVSSFKGGLDLLVSRGILVDDNIENVRIGEVLAIKDKARAPMTIIEIQEVKDV